MNALTQRRMIAILLQENIETLFANISPLRQTSCGWTLNASDASLPSEPEVVTILRRYAELAIPGLSIRDALSTVVQLPVDEITLPDPPACNGSTPISAGLMIPEATGLLIPSGTGLLISSGSSADAQGLMIPSSTGLLIPSSTGLLIPSSTGLLIPSVSEPTPEPTPEPETLEFAFTGPVADGASQSITLNSSFSVSEIEYSFVSDDPNTVTFELRLNGISIMRITPYPCINLEDFGVTTWGTSREWSEFLVSSVIAPGNLECVIVASQVLLQQATITIRKTPA